MWTARGSVYTKSTAAELALAMNRAGCALLGRPLVEATGSLVNFRIQAKNLGTDLAGAYEAAVAETAQRLEHEVFARHVRPNLLVLHASSHHTSNTMALWSALRSRLGESWDITEIGLRNGTLSDCAGCPYTMCLHFGERGGCFYGGVMQEEVYPAVRSADALLLLCPNYNDALSANLTACINRLTALFRQTRFYHKAVFALVVPRFPAGHTGAEGRVAVCPGLPQRGVHWLSRSGGPCLETAHCSMPPFWRCPSISCLTVWPAAAGRAARFRWKQLFTPCIVASVLGLVLAADRLRPPALVGEMLDFVGDITVPLSLLVVGSLLAGMSAGQVLRSPKLWLLTAIRLLLLPVALCLVLRALGIDSLVLGIAVTQMAMPVAVNGTLLSMEYGGDTECMAQITFLTTAASIVTIPIVAVLLL